MDPNHNKNYYKGSSSGDNSDTNSKHPQPPDISCIGGIIVTVLIFCGIACVVIDLSTMALIVSERPRHENAMLEASIKMERLAAQVNEMFKDFKPRLNVLNSMISYTIPSQISQLQVALMTQLRRQCSSQPNLENKIIYSTCVDPNRNETYKGVPMRELETLYNASMNFCSFMITGAPPPLVRGTRSLGICHEMRRRCHPSQVPKAQRSCPCRRMKVYCPFNYTLRMRKMLFDMEQNPCGNDL
nr:X protein [Paramyxoviridae sp.]